MHVMSEKNNFIFSTRFTLTFRTRMKEGMHKKHVWKEKFTLQSKFVVQKLMAVTAKK